jgi:phosphoribosylglycinamide formyltransferase-1
MTRKRVGVLISGRGSNLAALLAAARARDYPAEIALVVANRADAAGLDHAKSAGIAARVVPHRDFPDRESFDHAIHQALGEAGCDLVCCAGFMRVLTPWFVATWRGRLLNIHPSLLPAFPGLDTHRRAIDAGVRIAGCTVHFVSEGVDQGPIIAQAAVPVLPGDTPSLLADRVLRAEHMIYPSALAMVASGAARLRNSVVTIADRTAPADAVLLNPV